MDSSNFLQAKVALCAVLGVLGGIAITGRDLEPRKGILVWLLFVLVSGILINTQTGMPFGFLSLCAASSALSLVATIAWLLFLGVNTNNITIPISGVDLDFKQRKLLSSIFLLLVFLFTFFGIVICAYSRPLVLFLLEQGLSLKPSDAKQVEELLKTFFSIVGILGLLISAFLGFSRRNRRDQ